MRARVRVKERERDCFLSGLYGENSVAKCIMECYSVGARSSGGESLSRSPVFFVSDEVVV